MLCMGHVFNFAILGIPSSTIRNHPWKCQACTSAGTCSKETPCLQCKMSKSHWLWSFYIVNRGFLCYMFLHLYRPETFRDGSLWYWREFPIWRNWIHVPCTEYQTPYSVFSSTLLQNQAWSPCERLVPDGQKIRKFVVKSTQLKKNRGFFRKIGGK